MGIWKNTRTERVEAAKRIVDPNTKQDLDQVIKDVAQIIEKSLSIIHLKGTPTEIDLFDVKYKKADDEELFFVEFTKDGYIVVVGAGNDYGMPTSKKYLNVEILEGINREWSNRAILVPVKGLREVKGRSGTGPVNRRDNSSYFRCRNGVEMYLGQRLLDEGFQILNVQSHQNYSPLAWSEIVKSIKDL